jgi:hypothetical protein
LYSLAAACVWAVVGVAASWAHDALSFPTGVVLSGSVGMLAAVALMVFLLATRTKSWPWLTERFGVTAALTVLVSGCLMLPLVLSGPASAVVAVTVLLAWGVTEALLTAGISAVSVLTRSRWAPAFVGIYLGAGMSGNYLVGFSEFSRSAWPGVILLSLVVTTAVGFGLRALHRSAPLPG